MRNLLQLEESILSTNATLQNGFKIEEINQFQNEIFTSGVSKFQSSVKMSKIVKKSMEFFNSDVCKNQMQEEGISWTKEEFFMKLYGWKRAYGYKMLQVANIHTAKVNKFIRKMQEQRDNGQDTAETSISVENCLKFVRSENGEDVSNELPTPNPTIMKCFKMFNGVKKTITLKHNGDVKCQLETDEIELMIESLKTIILNNQGVNNEELTPVNNSM